MDSPESEQSPKVFISYAWSPERKQMVLESATKLLQDGLDVVLDQWNFHGGIDRFHFMEQSVRDPTITKVLIFSDRIYAEEANDRLGGVGAQTQIFTPQLYGEVTDSKCIPIACESDEDGNAWMPTYLKSRVFIDFRSEERRSAEYERLVKQLYGLPEIEKPPLGRPPSYVTEPNKPHRRSQTRFERWEQMVATGSPSSTRAEREYLVALREELPGYYLEIGEGEKEDQALIRSLTNLIPIRDELFKLFTEIIAEDPARAPRRIATVMAQLCGFKFYSESRPNWDRRKAEPTAFLCWELWIYITALLVSLGHPQLLDALLSRRFEVPVPARSSPFTIFHCMSDILLRPHSTYANHQSVVFSQRLTGANAISRVELIQADALLSLRAMAKEDDSWFAHLLVDRSDQEDPPMFQAARTSQGLQELALVLGVQDTHELVNAINKARDPFISSSRLARAVLKATCLGIEHPATALSFHSLQQQSFCVVNRLVQLQDRMRVVRALEG
jgi:TIR domain